MFNYEFSLSLYLFLLSRQGICRDCLYAMHQHLLFWQLSYYVWSGIVLRFVCSCSNKMKWAAPHMFGIFILCCLLFFNRQCKWTCCLWQMPIVALQPWTLAFFCLSVKRECWRSSDSFFSRHPQIDIRFEWLHEIFHFLEFGTLSRSFLSSCVFI